MANRLSAFYVVMVIAYGAWMAMHLQAEAKMRETAATVKTAPPTSADDDAILVLSGDAAALQRGAEVFKTTCSACHGAEGQGLLGPNLTDVYWLHGAKPAEIAHTIREGVLEKGMPAWGPALGEEKVKSAAAYVLTLKGKNVPGKPPQGEKVE